jgi:hypothetical protein
MMSYPNRIFIAGDSWGKGEWGWDQQQFKVLHPGLELYLKQSGYTVFNMSKPGGTLEKILNSLRTIKKTATPEDIVFLFVTETSRSFLSRDFWCFEHYQEYVLRHEHCLTEFLRKADQVGLNIKLLGGLSKLTQQHLQGLHNLEIAIGSVTEFLIPGYVHPEVIFIDHLHAIDRYRKIKNSEFLRYIDKITRRQQSGYLSAHAVDCIWKAQQQYDVLSTKSIMQPDGHHPNRQGHYEIFQQLQKIYKLVDTS